MKYDILLEAQGHGNKNGGRGKAKRNKSRSNTTGLCAAATSKSLEEGTGALASVAHISQKGLHVEPAHLNSYCTGSLWGNFTLVGASPLTLLKALSPCFFVAAKGASS